MSYHCRAQPAENMRADVRMQTSVPAVSAPFARAVVAIREVRPPRPLCALSCRS
jgi:hypothetical protein